MGPVHREHRAQAGVRRACGGLAAMILSAPPPFLSKVTQDFFSCYASYHTSIVPCTLLTARCLHDARNHRRHAFSGRRRLASASAVLGWATRPQGEFDAITVGHRRRRVERLLWEASCRPMLVRARTIVVLSQRMEVDVQARSHRTAANGACGAPDC